MTRDPELPLVWHEGETVEQAKARKKREDAELEQLMTKKAAEKAAKAAEKVGTSKSVVSGTANVTISDNPKIEVSMSIEKKIRAKEYYSIVDEYIDLLVNE